jgi:hypothetical protein
MWHSLPLAWSCVRRRAAWCRRGRGAMIFVLRAADFLCLPYGVAARVAAPGVVVEGRRDPYAAPSALGGPARAAGGSFAADVAGLCGAGAAGRDAADRAPRRDAGSSSLLAPSCAGIAASSAAAGRAGRAVAGPGARRCAARSGRWCCGRPGRTSHGCTAVFTASLPGSASRWHRRGCDRSSRAPGSTRRRAGMGLVGRSSCDRRRRRSWRFDFRPDRVPGPLQHGPAASGHRPPSSRM